MTCESPQEAVSLIGQTMLPYKGIDLENSVKNPIIIFVRSKGGGFQVKPIRQLPFKGLSLIFQSQPTDNLCETKRCSLVDQIMLPF